jgi:hypothetical protein
MHYEIPFRYMAYFRAIYILDERSDEYVPDKDS